MTKREARFTVYFRHWLKAHPALSAVFELKQTRTDSIAFNAVEPHQLNALLAAKGDQGVIYKIPDDSRGVKPFDISYHRLSDAYVVVKFPSCFVIIDATAWNFEQNHTTRKSLTLTRAKEIAEICVEI